MKGNGYSRLEEILESFGPNSGYVWDVLQEYLKEPEAVSETWRKLFASALGQSQPFTARPPVAATPTVTAAVAAPPGESARAIRGVAAKIVENMEASLSLPTATSFRSMPVRVLDENRRLLNQYLGPRSGLKISYTHLIAWAIVRALQKFPSLNASFTRLNGEPYRDEKLRINIGLAVDVTRKDGSRSLLVPNIKNAGVMGFDRFVEQYEKVIGKARTSTLEPSDFQDTSITLTNPGTVGTVASVPRLMPGQGAIIATGVIDYAPEHQGMSPETLSALGVSKVMTMTCTYDHRVIQGAESGQFLGAIEALLMGEERFYDELFADLGLPYEPVRWSTDQNPFIGGAESAVAEKHARVLQLINAYRVRGHLIAHLDPLADGPHNHPELDPSFYGLTLWDLDRRFPGITIEGMENATLREILDLLRATYCGSVGVEYMNIQLPVQKQWLQRMMEPSRNASPLTPRRRKQTLHMLRAAESFERFLHTKYIGHKRFSLEGAETVMAILDVVLDDLADHGGERAVIGMSHRGRLNVLANTIGKPLARLFSEFEGSVDPDSIQGSGDVKYHLGARGSHRSLNGNEITVEVAPNPSHLESVNPVVEGMVRAMQDRRKDEGGNAILPILIHGDAAFAGQGIVAETLNLSQLSGYRTGGTLHVIINNQIGFTTSPDDARSTPYCTDVARMVQAPIFHVNGDDPDAAVRVARLALSYRREFRKDVVIDMFCYRRYGHNEGDEPSYTQPLLYKKIKEHPSARTLYEQRLLREGAVTPEEVEADGSQVHEKLERAFDAAQKRELHFKADVPLAVTERDIASAATPKETAVPVETIAAIARAIGTVPKTFALHPKLAKFMDHRRAFDPEATKIDWAFAESLAFGSLVLEGIPVRLSGQDTARGTFSQRHSVLYDLLTGEEYVPLNHVREGQAAFSVYDSLLSEAAVLGFEFGYSVADPLTLVIWEAQFGDFSNGAQTIIDQYIVGSEAKWEQPCNLVLLLPHAYEGQGPEHSSARLERFLQLCAEENLQVCNVSTPAQYFHLLRRQMHSGRRKPLVVMTPKSLLRHPLVVSSSAEFAQGCFHTVIGDASVSTAGRMLFCSGKVYYDALQKRTEEKRADVALVRLEQLYPWPEKEIGAILKQHAHITDIVWLQEEPQNMGAWTFVEPRIRRLLNGTQALRYAGRDASASTATGSLKRHAEEQQAILAGAFGS